ncbi:MAG: hypothetical protein GY756_21055 [bacterium]|nr:hypothetical protein [bacterium]
MKKYFKQIILAIIFGVLLTSFTVGISTEGKRGIVEKEETAIKVAKILLHSVYGDKIDESLPFKAKSIKDGTVWLVEGTLNYDKGGVPYIEIQKSDCKIIRFGHGK